MSKKTLNESNLAALGAPQLAALLMEVSAGSADIKRRLRLELSHNLGASELAHDVRKRLSAIRKSSSFVGWRRRKALIKDLDTQVRMIVDKIAPDDPTEAFDLLWEFIDIAPSVYGRVDDSKGDVRDVFLGAFQAFEGIAPRAILDPAALADRVWTALQDNGYGEWDGIVPMMAETLGTDGLARLTAHVQTFAAMDPAPQSDDHEAIQFLRQLRGGDTYATDRKSRFVRMCLQDIAAAAGDTQAYIAQYSSDDLKRQTIAAEVAMLLADDGRTDDAIDLLLDADQDSDDTGQNAWDNAYIACLLDLGRTDEAQAHRWDCFTATLNRDHLRAHLKHLPDFEDIDAEDRAKQHVLHFASFPKALDFCVNWPDLATAARLIDNRPDDINGEIYAILTPAAEALRTRYPLSAVVLWRAMIDQALKRGQTFRYGAAAEFLADCVSVDLEITDYGTLVNHADYLHGLQDAYGHHASFWKKVG